MIYGLTLIILGLLAAPSLLLSKKPDAQALLDKITPYQGWIGLVFCVWGIWGIISAILSIGWLSTYPIYWIIWLAGSALEACLGFLLGYGLIVEYVLSKNEVAAQKGAELLKKLQPLQGKLGLAAIVVGLITIVVYYALGVA